MNKILVILWLCFSLNASAQYCLLFDIKVDEPEMVVSAMNDLMDTEPDSNLADKLLFQIVLKDMINAIKSL